MSIVNAEFLILLFFVKKNYHDGGMHVDVIAAHPLKEHAVIHNKLLMGFCLLLIEWNHVGPYVKSASINRPMYY